MKHLCRASIALLLALAASRGIGQARARLVSESPGLPPDGLFAQYPAVVTHTHNWRFSEGESRGSFEESQRDLVKWCARLAIRALGVGSAWDPENDALFQRFEGPDRDLYYSGKFDQKSVMQTAHIHAIIAHLNELSGGRTYFYLDNETPKNRMGHVWWFNYFYDRPAWHDYSQDRPIRMYRSDPSVEINPLNGQPHTRRDLFAIMAIQHHAGALGVFAHPTRWWVSDGRFVTNIAALAGLFLVANGRLDGLAMMSDRPFNESAQNLWMSFLDTGAMVPGFAETDFFLNQAPTKSGLETFRNYMHLGVNTITTGNIGDAARAGDSFASNGAFLTISIGGVPMGSVCRTSPDKRHRVRVEAYPLKGSRFSLIQLIGRHGAVLAEIHDFPGGVLEFELAGSDRPAYVLARAFGQGDDPISDPDGVQQAAITNPVYLYPAGFHVSGIQTRCVLHVPARSRWLGGTIEFQDKDGQVIHIHKVSPGAIRVTLPANARVVLKKAGRADQAFYISMENARVEKLLSYLTSGQFRNDYPNLKQGQVPPEAFHVHEIRTVLATFDYTID